MNFWKLLSEVLFGGEIFFFWPASIPSSAPGDFQHDRKSNKENTVQRDKYLDYGARFLCTDPQNCHSRNGFLPSAFMMTDRPLRACLTPFHLTLLLRISLLSLMASRFSFDTAVSARLLSLLEKSHLDVRRCFPFLHLLRLTLLCVAQFFFRTSIYIDGQWQNAAQNKVLPVVNPSTRKTIHYIASATAEDVDRAVDAAQKAFPSWSELSATARAKYLVALADEIEARKDDIARLETLDNGKPLREAVADINDVITCFRYYADAIQQFDEKKQDEAVDVGDPAFSATLRYDPVGVCGLIIPWNYPLLMAAWKVRKLDVLS
jgi:hypothetical protein